MQSFCFLIISTKPSVDDDWAHDRSDEGGKRINGSGLRDETYYSSNFSISIFFPNEQTPGEKGGKSVLLLRCEQKGF